MDNRDLKSGLQLQPTKYHNTFLAQEHIPILLWIWSPLPQHLVVNCKWMTSPYNCGWKRSVMFRDEYLKQTGACLPRIDCQYTATHGSLHDNSSFYSAAGYTFKKNNEHKNLWVAAILQWHVPFTEKAPTSTFSWLKVPTSAFTFKTLLRHAVAIIMRDGRLVSIVSYSHPSLMIIVSAS